MSYDAAGNLYRTHYSGDGYSYDDITTRNERYQSVSEDIRNVNSDSINMSGHTSFRYDVDGNLVYFNRGRYLNYTSGTFDTRDNFKSFTYDNDGHILTSTDHTAAELTSQVLYAGNMDPAMPMSLDGNGNPINTWDRLKQSEGTAQLGGYFYGLSNPMANLSSTVTLSLHKLVLQGATAHYDVPAVSYLNVWDSNSGGLGQSATLMGETFSFTLSAQDIVVNAFDGTVDRQTTALNIAARAYPSFNSLTYGDQAAVINDIAGRLPGDDTQIVAGLSIDLVGSVVARTLPLDASDIKLDANGNLDRTATARALAERVYTGFAELSAAGQAQVVAYIVGQLPVNNADVVAGATVSLNGYIVLLEPGTPDTTATVLSTYYKIGDTRPSGSVGSYTVRPGDTLQGISAMIYGSSAYWYLIADANQLTGNETLVAGTTLKIPDVLGISHNTYDNYNVYNQSKITGSTSAELTITQQKHSPDCVQIIVMIIVVIIIAIVAYYLIEFAVAAFEGAGAAGAAGGAAAGGGAGAGAAAGGGAAAVTAGSAASAGGIAGLGYSFGAAVGGVFGGGFAGLVATGLAVGAVGYGVGYATSFATQGLQILVGLQKEFNWKAMQDMGKSFAITAVSAGLGKFASANLGNSVVTNALVQGGIQVGAQYLENGKITNYTGIVLAMIPGGGSAATATESTAASVADAGKESSWLASVGSFLSDNKRSVGVGLNLLEQHLRGKDIDWTNVAANTLMQSLNVGNSSRYVDNSGTSFNWQTIATDALVSTAAALFMGHKYGESQAIGYLGNQLGTMATGMLGADQEIEKNLAKQAAFNAYADAQFAAYDAFLASPRFAQADAASNAPNSGVPTPEAPQPAPVAPQGAAGQAGAPAPVVVASGNTVEQIARQQYGDNWRAGVQAIVNANNLDFNSLGSPLIYPGDQLEIPPLPTDSNAQADLAQQGGNLIAANQSKIDAEAARQAAAMQPPSTVPPVILGSPNTDGSGDSHGEGGSFIDRLGHALADPNGWDIAGTVAGTAGFIGDKFGNNVAVTETKSATYRYGSVSAEQSTIVVDSSGNASIETTRTPIASGESVEVSSDSTKQLSKKEVLPSSETTITTKESSGRLTPGLIAEGGEANVTSTTTTALKDSSMLAKSASVAGRVLGGPEAGAAITALSGATEDMNNGVYRKGRDLWIATTLDATAGVLISGTADVAGVTAGVFSSAYVTPVGGVIVGGAVAGGVSYAGGAGWTAIRSDVINAAISATDTIEGTYNNVSKYVQNVGKSYCLFHCN
jgi:nucleoid-associated protein YgaU